jgi:predicted DCC family thiol-disulfide oxidoreductase YuxK
VISLASEMTESKGRHARGWLFFDAECEFCTRIARWLGEPMKRPGLAATPLQDPRVASLLGLSPDQLKRTIRFVLSDGQQYLGAEAVLAVVREVWWSPPLAFMSRIPGALFVTRAGYRWVARRRRCRAQQLRP